MSAAPTSKHQRILRNAPFAIIEHDDDLRVVDWNDGAAGIFGYPREEAVGRTLQELGVTSDGEAWRRAVRGVRMTVEGARKDGGAVTCAWYHDVVTDEAGAPAGVVCFGRDVTAEIQVDRKHEQERHILRAMIENLPVCVWAVDLEGTFTIHDGKALATAGLKRGQFLGLSVFEAMAGTESPGRVRRALAGETIHDLAHTHGVVWESWIVPVRDEAGALTSVAGITLDVSESKRVEQELRDKLDMVERQQKVIRELATPIIEVWSKVLTLPMVGVVDSARTAEVMDSLLEAVVRSGARFAILDLTGVEAIDTKTAAYLFELIRAVRLLGAEGIITGIRGSVAQTMVQLGVDMSSIVTLGNLRAGLKHCMVQMSREDSKPDRPAPAR